MRLFASPHTSNPSHVCPTMSTSAFFPSSLAPSRLTVAHTRCRKNDYPNHSYRDRLRFLVFTSWWTVVFTALFLVFFLINKLSFIVSIASHGIWFALTYVLLTFPCIPSTDRVTQLDLLARGRCVIHRGTWRWQAL